MPKKAYLLVLLSLLFSLPSYAEEPAERLVALLAFQQYQADFTQQTTDADGKVLQELQGRIVLEKPDHFYWQSGEPFLQQIISDGKTIWHYDEDLEQVVIQRYSEQLEGTPLLLILNNSDHVKHSFIIESYRKKRKIEQFSLRLKEANNSIQTLQLEFAKEQLTGLQFKDNLQQVTAIQFENMTLNQPADASLFLFKVPEGADVLYE